MKKHIWISLILMLLMALSVGCLGLNGNESERTESEQASTMSGDTAKVFDEVSTESEENKTEADKTLVTTEEGITTEEEVRTEEEKEVILDESKAVTVWTTASTLNLRKNPNTSSEVLKVLKRGTKIKKYEEADGWALVKSGDILGYVSEKYISKEKPEEPTTAKQDETTTSGKEQGGGSKVEAIPGQHRNPNRAVVVIDPGHQAKGDKATEPIGPGSSEMKTKVTYGTTGVATGVKESELNLAVGLKLRTELENRGYTVYMTRITQNVNISNKERAEYGNSKGADAVIRIHANSASASAKGAETLYPSSSNAFVKHLSAASKKLSRCVIDSYCKATGFKNRGAKTNDSMTGINWSEIPVTIIELGFMSNGDEDRLMQDADMQNNMVQGIANGLDAYFGF